MAAHQKRIGERIAARREELDLSQEEAAHLIPVTIRAYQKWESGESNPYPRNWAKLAKAFDTTKEALQGKPPADVEELEDQLDRIEETQRVILGKVSLLAEGNLRATPGLGPEDEGASQNAESPAGHKV